MIYLHVLEACLKVIIAMFYFCHSNHPSNIMKNIFNSISIYFWKKNSSLTNITNKCVIRKIMYICKNLLNLDCKDSIRFDICKMKGHLGRVFPSHFLQNVLIETSCVCFKNFSISYRVLCYFLISWSLEYSKHINRGGICTLKACL